MSREQQTPTAPPQPRRFIAIPFSSGCRSHSSVDVVHTAAARLDAAGKKPHPQGVETGAAAALSGGASSRPPPSAASTGGGKGESLVARLLRGFKNLSQIFAIYDEDDDDEDAEREMVIGLPTDVKHVAHIGWDGSTSTTASLRSWNRAPPPPPPAPLASTPSTSSSSSSSAPAAAAQPRAQRQPREEEPYPLPLPALSMRQFELAMAAQAAAGGASATTATNRRHS